MSEQINHPTRGQDLNLSLNEVPMQVQPLTPSLQHENNLGGREYLGKKIGGWVNLRIDFSNPFTDWQPHISWEKWVHPRDWKLRLDLNWGNYLRWEIWSCEPSDGSRVEMPKLCPTRFNRNRQGRLDHTWKWSSLSNSSPRSVLANQVVWRTRKFLWKYKRFFGVTGTQDGTLRITI